MGFSPMPRFFWYSGPMRRCVLGVPVLVLALALPAEAVEYRLQVASVHERSFAH